MFDKSITDGVELTKFKMVDGKKIRAGTYWKLGFVCARERCNNIVDECFCFSTKEAMEKAKGENLYCSTACWADSNPEKFEKSIREFKDEIQRDDPERFDCINWDSRDDVIEAWGEYLSDFYDGADLHEELGADMECPI